MIRLLGQLNTDWSTPHMVRVVRMSDQNQNPATVHAVSPPIAIWTAALATAMRTRVMQMARVMTVSMLFSKLQKMQGLIRVALIQQSQWRLTPMQIIRETSISLGQRQRLHHLTSRCFPFPITAKDKTTTKAFCSRSNL